MQETYNHTKELREIAEGQARMETKMDSVLSAIGDHEARLRIAESTLAVHTDLKDAQTALALRVTTVEKSTDDHEKVIANIRKVVWSLAMAVLSALGLGAYELFIGGANNG